MIKINLAPVEELEIKHWYLPDALALATALLAIYFGVEFYLQSLRNEITRITDETNEVIRNTDRLKPQLQQYAQMKTQMDRLQEKLASLEKITVSKIERYKPIILLEHLQNIKPEGVWFSYLVDDSDHQTIYLAGGAFDNLLVAEFISLLEATRQQDADSSDLRSQVYFRKVLLGQVSLAGVNEGSVRSNPSSPLPVMPPPLPNGNPADIKGDKADLQKKAAAAAAAQAQAQAQAQASAQKAQQIAREESAGNASGSDGHKRDSEKYFPEVKKYPAFTLTIRYAERGTDGPQ